MVRPALVGLLVVCAACGPATEPSCADGEANGDETDVDCGGPCQPCTDGSECVTGADCTSQVCTGMCAAPTCSDGIRNGGEQGPDCAGPCPMIYTPGGCTAGTNGSMVCTSYTSGDMFTVTITWNAAGGHAYVDYVTAYGMGTEEFNSDGVLGGNAVNICTSGPMSVTFELPVGYEYTYKVWHAYCVRDDACDGCGDDAVTDTGGPFGIYPTC